MPRAPKRDPKKERETYLAKLWADLVTDQPLLHEDGTPRDATLWPNGARALRGTVSWLGRGAIPTWIYRDPTRRLVARDDFGREKIVSFDEVVFDVPAN